MSAVMESVGFVPVAKPHEAMLQAVRALADGPLAELADDIDRRGISPRASCSAWENSARSGRTWA